MPALTPAHCPPRCPEAYVTLLLHQPQYGAPARQVTHVSNLEHGSSAGRQSVEHRFVDMLPVPGTHFQLFKSQPVDPAFAQPSASHTSLDAEPGVPAATTSHVADVSLHLYTWAGGVRQCCSHSSRDEEPGVPGGTTTHVLDPFWQPYTFDVGPTVHAALQSLKVEPWPGAASRQAPAASSQSQP